MVATLGMGLLWAVMVSDAHGEDINLSEMLQTGRWRVEGGYAHGLDSGQTVPHTSDYYVTGSIEYEVPVDGAFTMGWRSYPLFLFRQKDERNYRQQDDLIAGVGTGLALRLYADEVNLRGFYGELGGILMWHSDEFHKNNSRWNFLTEGGLGYAFDNNWHLAVKLQHISNCGMASPNSGVNAVFIGGGFTF